MHFEIVGKGSIRGTKEQQFYSCLDCLALCNIQSALNSKCHNVSADSVVLSTNQVLRNMLGGSKVLLVRY
jgi:hypothetical protein